jgi:putative ABC transport system ATP-binding protein
MLVGHMGKQATDEQTRSFLALFDNNPEAATQSIQAIVDTEKRLKTTVPALRQLTPAGNLLIHVDSLRKEYRVGHKNLAALNGVSFDVFEGEFVAITGSSGSGKSTLLQLMGGLEKPTSGSVTIGGVNLGKMSDRKLSRFRGQTIGFVFQFFYLQPFLRIGRNIEVPGMFARTKRKERQARVHELAEAVGLSDRLDHLPKELSGGQIQRFFLPMNRPETWIA